MPTTIPQKADFGAERLALLQQLGLDPGSLAGFQDSFVQNSNNLYQQLAQLLSQSQSDQTDVETNYERSLAQTMADQKRQRDALEAKLAYRGVLSGSAAVDEIGKQTQDYQNVYDQMGQTKSKALSDILGSRNFAQSQYDVGLGNERTNLTQGASAYLQQIAQRQADQALAQQQAQQQTAQTDAMLQSNNTIAQQIAQMNAQPIDLSKYANLFVQNTPQTVAPVPQPVAPKVPSVNDPGRVALTSSYVTFTKAKSTVGTSGSRILRS